jgi:hypothetical protein
MAAIARAATSLVFPNGNVSTDQDARYDAPDSGGDTLEDKLSDLDGSFCDYPDDLTALLFAYVQDHRDSIRGAEPG